MFTFRTSITFAVMAFIVALTALLIAIQVRALHWATREAASAYMDATSTKAFGRLQTEIAAVASLATSSSVADSNERTETGRAIPLFKAALQELPQMDSIYAGFENGAWLQLRRMSELNDEQKAPTRTAKYVGPHGEVWTGVGAMASWLRKLKEAGEDIEKYRASG
jgi:adenylate cyclase